MRHSFCVSLSVFLLVFFTSSYAGDFNIKLRKTDVGELKQQLIPVFEQNIHILNQLLNCLEKGTAVDICIDDFLLVVDDKDLSSKQRSVEIRKNIKNKISEKSSQPKKITSELRNLILEAEKVKQCLQKGKTVNELKDCVLLYDKKAK